MNMNVSISEVPAEFAAMLADNMTITDAMDMLTDMSSEFEMPVNTSAEFTAVADWMNNNTGTMMETIETVV